MSLTPKNSPVRSLYAAGLLLLGCGALAACKKPYPTITNLRISSQGGCAVGKDNALFCWGAGFAGPNKIERRSERTERVEVTDNSALCTQMRGQVSCTAARPTGDATYPRGFIGAVVAGGTLACHNPAPGSLQCHRLGVLQERVPTYEWSVSTPELFSELSVSRHGVAVVTAAGQVFVARANLDAAEKSGVPPLTAVDMRDAVHASLGARHGCVARKDGQVVCFGENDRGQLGLGRTSPLGVVEPPTVVPGIDDVVAVASGDEFTCARRKNGGVACWGDNRDFQITSAVTADVASTPQPIYGIFGAKDLSASGRSVCVALGPEEGARCWGDNAGDHLGSGTGDPRLRVPMPIRLPR
jgi:hypothetical protein